MLSSPNYENSTSLEFYNSTDYLTTMLSSNCLNVVLAVLDVLHILSQHRNFISQLASDGRIDNLLSGLLSIAEVLKTQILFLIIN
jgi:hypothetical protein